MIQEESLICAACGYILHGLPEAGRCPECGAAYVVQPFDPARALAAFHRAIPSPLRLWRQVQSPGGRNAVVRSLFLLATTALLAGLFVAAQVLIAYVRYRISPPWGKDAIGNIVAEAGVSWGFHVNVSGCVYVLTVVLTGQYVLLKLLRVWWSFDAWRYSIPRDLSRSMYRTAAVLVPVLVAIPMAAALAWQSMNWWMPAESGDNPSLRALMKPWCPRQLTVPDVPLLIGAALLLVSVATTAVLLVRLNHRALRAIRTGTRGARLGP